MIGLKLRVDVLGGGQSGSFDYAVMQEEYLQSFKPQATSSLDDFVEVIFVSPQQLSL